MTPPRSLPVFAAVAFAAATVTAQQQAPPKDDRQSFRFRSAVELINVTTTVTDSNGRFVSDLRQEDFRVFEDGQEQPITHFSNERVPVSLGIALDTSYSMNGEKMSAARDALRRFLGDLLDPADEVFLYRFSNVPELVEGWTTNRDRLLSRLNRILLVRLDESRLVGPTKERAAAGVVAYTAICTHTGCDVTDWLPDEGLLYGPAPRPLPALPLRIADGQLVVAGAFTARVTFDPA